MEREEKGRGGEEGERVKMKERGGGGEREGRWRRKGERERVGITRQMDFSNKRLVT